MRIFQCTFSALTGHAKTTVKNSPRSEKLDSFATQIYVEQTKEKVSVEGASLTMSYDF